MLPTTLNTNEIKNSAGTEVEFSRRSTEGRKLIFETTTIVPSQPHLLTISHQEVGAGFKLVRRSAARFDKTVISTVDSITPVTISSYMVTVVPIGALLAFTEVNHVQAELMSFVASRGASTTILYDGTGYGAEALRDGSL